MFGMFGGAHSEDDSDEESYDDAAEREEEKRGEEAAASAGAWDGHLPGLTVSVASQMLKELLIKSNKQLTTQLDRKMDERGGIVIDNIMASAQVVGFVRKLLLPGERLPNFIDNQILNDEELAAFSCRELVLRRDLLGHMRHRDALTLLHVTLTISSNVSAPGGRPTLQLGIRQFPYMY